MQIRLQDSEIFQGFERSVLVIATVLRMIIGLGLAVALVLKVYMLVLTDLTCAEDGTSLGNTIRCTEILDMVSASIILIAALGLSAAFFSPRRINLPETLLMMLMGVVIAFVADLTIANATWQVAIVLVALFSGLGGLLLLKRLPGKSGED